MILEIVVSSSVNGDSLSLEIDADEKEDMTFIFRDDFVEYCETGQKLNLMELTFALEKRLN